MASRNFSQNPSEKEESVISITVGLARPKTPYAPLRKTRKSRRKKISDFVGHLEGFSSFPLHTELTYPVQLLLRKKKMAKK